MRVRIKNIKLHALVLLTFGSCQKKNVAPAEYMRYMENEKNGLRKAVTVGDWKYTVQYTPGEYQIVHERGSNNEAGANVPRAMAAKSRTVLFNVRINHARYASNAPLRLISRNMDDYARYESYYLNEAQKDFRLICGSDTLAPSVYQFETSYNLAPHDVMIVGFNADKLQTSTQNDLELTYHDHVLRNGIVRFVFSNKHLQAIPQVNLSTL